MLAIAAGRMRGAESTSGTGSGTCAAGTVASVIHEKAPLACNGRDSPVAGKGELRSRGDYGSARWAFHQAAPSTRPVKATATTI